MQGMDRVKFLVLLFILQFDIVSLTTGCGKLQLADVAFLMDQSGSVGSENFQKNLQFITKFVDIFEVGNNGIQISAFAFNEHMGDGFYFSCCHDKTSIKNSINNISYGSGSLDFEMGLAFARNNIFQTANGARDSAIKMLFLFTDGQSPVQNGGDILRQQGILVYAVGVGSWIDSNQLNKIATNSSYVFFVSDYSDLVGSVFNTLINKACNVILQNPCERNPQPCINGDCVYTGGTDYICLCKEGYTGRNCEIDIDYCVGVVCHNGGNCVDGLTDYSCQCPARYTGRHCDIDKCIPFPSDVVIMIDSSSSVDERFFNISKETIRRITKKWQITTELFQVAIISYADNARIELDFDTSMNKLKLDKFVEQLKQTDGTSEIHKGFSLAKNMLNQRNRVVGQTPVRKIIILLSDGLPSTPSNLYNQAYSGIEVFAVAIGEDVSHYWLNKIVGNERFVFPYNNDKLWNYMINTLVDQTCNVCQKIEENDLIIAVDTSKASTPADLSKTIPTILDKLLTGVNLGTSKTKVALMTYSSKAETMFDFNEFNEVNRNDMQRRLSYFTQSNDTRANITAMLHGVFELIQSSADGARSSAKKYLIVLSGFNEHVSLEDKVILNNLQTSNVEIFTIGLHDSEDEFNVMSSMASTAFHIGIHGELFFNSIDQFVSSLHEQLQSLTCKL